MLHLRTKTKPEWASTVIADLDSFLVDHAACERKASATAMAFVVRYPDKHALIEPMVELAREELEHFQQVFVLMRERGLELAPDEKDAYVNHLLNFVRVGKDIRLLDRLLVAGVVEARGCERFGLLAESLPPGKLKEAYLEFTRAEARHHGLFVRLAKIFFTDEEIKERLDVLLQKEAEIVDALPIRAALH